MLPQNSGPFFKRSSSRLKGKYFSLPLGLTLSMVTCLALLINVSFKVVQFKGMLFSASSILCPLVACLYLLVFKICNYEEQRHILNQSLLALYLFSLLVFVLVNLPASPYMLDQSAYQIVFDDIPRKFFAATVAFCFSFYLPHWFFCRRARSGSKSDTQINQVLVAVFGGLAFFTIDFFFLFGSPLMNRFWLIYLDSVVLVTFIMTIVALFYLSFWSGKGSADKKKSRSKFPLYNYLVSLSVVILLICQSCEYRLVSLGEYSLVASGLFFPLCIMASNIIGEIYGLRANLHFVAIMSITEFIFDGLLILIISLPSPDFLNLNPFYLFIMPRRILATSLSLLITFLANSFLLEELKKTAYGKHRYLRMLIANLIVTSVLCLVNYLLLFTGIYAYEQIVNLVLNGWFYKFFITVFGLPLVLWVNDLVDPHKAGTGVSSW